jgi:hypothetical protein
MAVTKKDGARARLGFSNSSRRRDVSQGPGEKSCANDHQQYWSDPNPFYLSEDRVGVDLIDVAVVRVCFVLPAKLQEAKGLLAGQKRSNHGNHSPNGCTHVSLTVYEILV